MSNDDEDLDRRTATVLHSGALHLMRRLRAVDRSAGLTWARLSALSVLVFGGPRGLGELAEAEDVAGPTMTRIVHGLAAMGLAERQPHPYDRRAVRIAATAAGEELMRTAARHRVDAVVAALATLSPAERKRIAAAADLLDRVAQAIEPPTGTTSTRPAGR